MAAAVLASRTSAILACMVFTLSHSANADQVAIIAVSNDKKIAVYSIDEANHSLKLVSSIETSNSPGAMCVGPNGKYLYAVMKGLGGITAFSINHGDKTLTKIGESTFGDNGSYVSAHPNGKHLYSSYYKTGKVRVHAIGNDGSLSQEPLQVISTDERAHAMVLGPQGKFAFVPHTRPNAIFQFVVDQETGKLTANDRPKLVRDAGGPRHLWFHPGGKFAFGSDEQGSSVTAYRFNQANGTLSVTQTVSSLPEDYKEKNSTSDIEVHPTGKFVYISNRGHDSIAAFSIAPETGKLELIGRETTEETTRSFNISPDGRFLIAAGQRSGKAALFRINDDGSLKRTFTTAVGQGPWWVQIVDTNNK